MNKRMRLRAGCEMKLKAAEGAGFVSMLRPRSGDAQWVVSESFVTDPFTRGIEYTDAFGNLCQRLQAPAEQFELKTEVEVDVDAELAVDRTAPRTIDANLPHAVLQYLLPSRYCPSDRMMEKASLVAKHTKPGYPQVEGFVRWIRDNIEYRYGVSDGSTSALDTIEDKAGVCRDFAHIGISFCRAMGIPARMVVGYLYGLEPMDLHAWFEAFVGDRWYTFDATQDAPRGGRIAVAYGRDATDVALITQFGELSTENMRVWVEKL
jgi:transglutaminase-like putative cysteine protease